MATKIDYTVEIRGKESNAVVDTMRVLAVANATEARKKAHVFLTRNAHLAALYTTGRVFPSTGR